MDAPTSGPEVGSNARDWTGEPRSVHEFPAREEIARAVTQRPIHGALSFIERAPRRQTEEGEHPARPLA